MKADVDTLDTLVHAAMEALSRALDNLDPEENDDVRNWHYVSAQVERAASKLEAALPIIHQGCQRQQSREGTPA